MKNLRVAVLDPGHFHAALSLRESHPALDNAIHVYAPEGPGLDAFSGYIESFNARANSPTAWDPKVHRDSDPLGALIRDRQSDIVILAGRNNTKMAAIERLTAAGFMIFADKPWVIDERGIPPLLAALGPSRPAATDIMTSRFEPTSKLLRLFMAEPEVFGSPRIDPKGAPTLSFQSVHHLHKVVNGSVLRRPEWYFDVAIQGEGIVDVTTHLVDLAHWLLFPGATMDFARDIRIQRASRLVTPVTLEKFKAITGGDRFPESVATQVSGNVLQLFCNGEIGYTARGIPVEVRVAWNVESPSGGGDTHHTIARGTRADLIVRQLPERGYRREFVISPHADGDALHGPIEAALRGPAAAFQGTTVRREKNDYLVEIPPALVTTHEQHFCEARNAFLDDLAVGVEPPGHRASMIAKYTLLAEARRFARAAS